MPQKLPCVVTRVSAHHDRVYTIELKPSAPVPRFRPGQFLHLALDPYAPSGFWPESRAFSIASSPAQRDLVQLTYAVHGRFTTRMERELSEGREVWIKLPFGEFVVDERLGVVLFAGGTGVTAFTAFLRTTSTSLPIVLAYGARTNQLFVYQDLVQQCRDRLASFEVVYFAESAVSPSDSPETVSGKISVEAVWSCLERPHDMVYYIAGPVPMLKVIGDDLRRRNISPEAIRIDAWE